jgi:hypothetical protein
MAAVQYGPASKTLGGLGFLDPLEGGLHRACGEGVRLAQAIDQTISTCIGAHLLGLEARRGTEDDARSLFSGWSVFTPTSQERAAFRKAFFDDSTVGDESDMGRRSATLALARLVLSWARRPMELDEIRRAMVYVRTPELPPLALPGRLATARLRWAVLQLRQTQRLAHECLLVWIERRLVRGDRDSEALLHAAMAALEEMVADDLSDLRVGDMAERLVPDVTHFEALCDRATVDDDACIFAAAARVTEAVDAEVEDDVLVAQALRAMLLCAKAAELLSVEPVAERIMATGRAERVSLKHWRETVARCWTMPVREFLMLVFEGMVLSQHFAVAANRYDGGTQRLRITIEEEGLTLLAPDAWWPRLTPDRLASALALAGDCGLIKVREESNFEAT